MSSTTKVFSPSRLTFFAPDLQADYVAAGTWPADGVVVSNDAWHIFTSAPPAGQKLGADSNGLPVWVLDSGAPAPPPVVVTIIPATAFIKRFHPDEMAQIVSNPGTLILAITCAAAQTIDLSDPEVIAGVMGLVPLGILSSQRANEILKTS